MSKLSLQSIAEPLDERAPSTTQDLSRRAVKVEVNLLRLPLFALHTKGLRELDGFACRGTFRRAGQEIEYAWRVTRHATRPFPGPLARAAHLALLQIITEQGLPFRNPVTWGWRDLCRRIGTPYSGRAVQQLKEALRATQGVIIEARGAIYSKATGGWIELDEDDRQLYGRLKFYRRRQGSEQPIERNSLWLADWYLDSLNALYTAPLDHQLWRALDKNSPIASRLYEYLLPNLHGRNHLRINNPRLAQALPVRVERYYSDARKQLDPALRLLEQLQVLSGADWLKRKDAVAQLTLHRGPALAAAGRSSAADLAVPPSSLEVRELRRRISDEERIVASFYRLWLGNSLRRPTSHELSQAKALIAEHGAAKAKALIPLVVQQLRLHWPSAKAFGAVAAYLPAAETEYVQQQRRKQQQQAAKRQQQAQQQRSLVAHRNRAAWEAVWQPVWEKLSAAEQELIRAQALEAKRWLKHMPHLWHSECLKVLADRHDGRRPDVQTSSK